MLARAPRRPRLPQRTLSLGRAHTFVISAWPGVCNRGTNPVPDGARVVFYEGDPDAGGTIACETTLPRLLDVGECTDVSCDYTIPEGETPAITVVVDPDGEVFECRDGNNRGVIPEVFCGLL